MKSNFSGKIHLLAWVCAGLLGAACAAPAAPDSMPAADPELRIMIGDDAAYPGRPEVTLENSVYRAVFRTGEKSLEEEEKNAPEDMLLKSSIQEWFYKEQNLNQIIGNPRFKYLDSSAHRGPARSARVVSDLPDEKTVRVEFERGGKIHAITEYTIYGNSPVIRIYYAKYPQEWCNTVDIGSPGGLKAGLSEEIRANGHPRLETRIYGQEHFTREICYHEETYWRMVDLNSPALKDSTDPPDGGPLNYKGHLIMAVADPENGVGFGRVMPIFAGEKHGGVRILKLLWDMGFETFPGTGKGQESFEPFVGYLFLFDNGLDDAIELGKSIVDRAISETAPSQSAAANLSP